MDRECQVFILLQSHQIHYSLHRNLSNHLIWKNNTFYFYIFTATELPITRHRQLAALCWLPLGCWLPAAPLSPIFLSTERQQIDCSQETTECESYKCPSRLVLGVANTSNMTLERVMSHRCVTVGTNCHLITVVKLPPTKICQPRWQRLKLRF